TGAGIRWEPRHAPTRAWYQCENGCEIDEEHKPWMDEQGEWRAHNPAAFPRHRSFHIWAAYSQHPGAAWLEIAREFLEVRHDPNLLRNWVNRQIECSNPQKTAVSGLFLRVPFGPPDGCTRMRKTAEIRQCSRGSGRAVTQGVTQG
ncbi:terminase gpA endonuclease subunit, partial [Sphingomonas sp. S-NIH.Pt1_0416]|uniref:terminase gpA endonuclease subunit n=1 Tax=Sphingomonas sp. S-NIH.Pt1_0416 TaxID=1920123 RepID=UPI001F4A07D9